MAHGGHSRAGSRAITRRQQAAFLAALGAGRTITEAAELADASVPGFYALKSRDEEFADAWQAAREIAVTIRRDFVVDKLHLIASDDDHRAQFAALSKLFDALPENRTKTLELAASKPIIVEHRRGLTVADLLADPRAVRLVEATRRELPAAGEVLAEPS